MAKFITEKDQHWEISEFQGKKLGKCKLWEGKHNLRSGLYILPAGMVIKSHQHKRFFQVLVMSGEVRVDVEGFPIHTVGAGEYYCLEPGENHVETAMEDTLLFFVSGP